MPKEIIPYEPNWNDGDFGDFDLLKMIADIVI